MTPAFKCVAERRRRSAESSCRKRLRSVVPRRVALRQHSCEAFEDGHRLFPSAERDLLLAECFEDFLTYRQPRLLGLHDVGDCLSQRLTARCKPDGVDVTFEQLPVRELDQRRTHFAVHHLPRIAEEVLIVGAAGSAVRDYERRLSTAASTTGAL